MANDIEGLREHLFETMKALKDKDSPMEIERARAIADVAQTIINTAKVEVDYMRVAGGKGTGFVPEEKQLPGTPEKPRLVRGKSQSGSVE
jgi:hypothetical protein